MERTLLNDALSVNKLAWKLVEKLCRESDFYGVNVDKTDSGATIVDAGIKAKGGFQAGKVVTEVCMGGCGKAEIGHRSYGKLELPSVFIYSDHPIIATLGSQFAGWQIKEGEYFAIGSGPARALALKPKDIYDNIGYRDDFNKAVVVLETDQNPSANLVERFAHECKISPENIAIILTPTSSITGATQISGRIVETGIHKLTKLGLDPKSILYAWGSAPIAPIHPKFKQAMARTNDAILYGGTASYTISYEDDEKLENIVKQAPSTASKMMQEARRLAEKNPRFLEIYKEAGFDFYKIDPNIFAPAIVVVNNIKTGKTFRAGSLDIDVMKGSLGL